MCVFSAPWGYINHFSDKKFSQLGKKKTHHSMVPHVYTECVCGHADMCLRSMCVHTCVVCRCISVMFLGEFIAYTRWLADLIACLSVASFHQWQTLCCPFLQSQLTISPPVIECSKQPVSNSVWTSNHKTFSSDKLLCKSHFSLLPSLTLLILLSLVQISSPLHSFFLVCYLY